MMKKFILPAMFMAFGLVTLVACDGEDIDPCGDWWLEVELDPGAEWIDVDGDGEPDGVTFMEGDEVITIICDGADVDGDCIPDCIEAYMDGDIEDEDEDGDEEEDEDGDEEEDEDEGEDEDEVEDVPCDDWWVGLELIEGAIWEDVDGDGSPDALTYYDAETGETITLVCVGDLDEDCIADCYEEYIL